MIDNFGVESLIDDEQYEILDFESLMDDGTYTLGPWRQQQQQHHQQQQAFLVATVVRGAKQSNGCRGNVFTFLEMHLGHYSEQEKIQIRDGQDNLYIKIYFLSYNAACQFQTALNGWEIHKELANLRAVTLDPLTPAQVARPVDFRRTYLQDYHPQDSESPY